MHFVATRVLVLLTALLTAACAGTIRPPVRPAAPPADAILILPGLGYTAAGARAMRALAAPLRDEGFDLYVPDYIARSGLAGSRHKLRRFIQDQRLERYERVHVFAFLAGAWTFNPIATDLPLPNLATVVYDRSPYQERAPRIAVDRLRLLARLRHGRIVADLAREPYVPLPRSGVRVGLVVETVPTSFVRRHAATADSYGPFSFDCEGFGQPFDDCLFIPLDHSELYTRFREVWPEVRTFIRDGRFSAAADRTPPTPVRLSESREGSK
ncbi:MAG TPA: hypothetical protein VM364_13400 [Vicinamibacterales bacterium]|nr:hypothetical protein [Vicinamibacterales bacterium]